MIKHKWDILFSEYGLRDFLNAKLAKINDQVLSIDKGRFERETDDLLSASVASEFVVSPIELLEDKISVSHIDAKVEVENDIRAAIFGRSGYYYVDGLEVTYHLPFLGDEDILKCQPSTFNNNPPCAVISSSSELTFPYDLPNREVASTKAWFEKDLMNLKEWLSRVNQQVAQYNSSLEPKVRLRIQQRRQELKKTEDDIISLGYAVHTQSLESDADPPSSRETAVAERKVRRDRKRRKYDVALSFAGENRDYVEQVAEQLVQLEVTVFYDRFEQVNLWGKDLAEHLGAVYSKGAHFVVIFASRAYADKAWPKHEKQFALSRHLKGEQGRILPVRIDDTEIPGVPGTIAYLDARVLTPIKLAELIRQKVDSEGSNS